MVKFNNMNSALVSKEKGRIDVFFGKTSQVSSSRSGCTIILFKETTHGNQQNSPILTDLPSGQHLLFSALKIIKGEVLSWFVQHWGYLLPSWAERVVVVLWVPSIWQGGPPVVFVDVEEILNSDVFLGEHGVTLAECSVTSLGVVPANNVAVFDSILVLYELANAFLAVPEPGALDAVFVLFAHGVKGVDGRAISRIRHGSVT